MTGKLEWNNTKKREGANNEANDGTMGIVLNVFATSCSDIGLCFDT